MHRQRGLLVLLMICVVVAAAAPAADARTSAQLATVSQVAAVPRPDHVVVVVMENHSSTNIIGNPAAPYINSLATSGASMTQSYAITHPSQPNYIALFSGSTNGVTGDSCPYTFSTPNLGAELIAAGLRFGGYSESMPSIGYTGCAVNNYARKHNPWVNFTNVPAASNLPLTSFPTDFSSLPTVSFVIPNLLNDMHDGTVAQADTWLQGQVDGYVTWAKQHNSILLLTWDEDDNRAGNQIPTLFVGAGITTGQYSEHIDHYTVLRTLQDAYGLAPIGASATADPILDIWTPPAGTPTAAFTVSCTDLTCRADGSGSSAGTGTISGYSWNWGDGSAATSGATDIHTYAGPGDFQVRLTVTNDAGLTGSVAHPVSPRARVDPNVLASDSFNRTVVNGFGRADIGGQWSAGGTASRYSVTPGTASMTMPTAGTTTTVGLPAMTTSDADLRVAMSPDKIANNNGTYATIVGRRVATSTEYQGVVRIRGDGVPILSIAALKGSPTGVTLKAATAAPGIILAAGAALNVRFQVTGTHPTSLGLKVWPATAAEPVNWQSTVTDSFTGLQTAGSVAISSYVSSGSTNAPIVLRLTDFSARSTTVPPANSPPIARLTVNCTNLLCSADGTGSTDTDGTIASYSWNWGDGTVTTGATSSHSFAGAGTRTVTLTVTDNQGGTDTATGTANPTAPAPANVAPTAVFSVTCADLGCSADGTASTDTDGTIASYSWNWGDGTVTTGVMSSHTYPAAGSFAVTLTVTDDRGGTNTSSHQAVPATPPDDAFVRDQFDRTVSGGWGAANVGGNWTLGGGAANFSVGGGKGSMTISRAGATLTGYLLGQTKTNTDLTMSVSTDKLANNSGIYYTFVGRRVGTNLEYQSRARVSGTGSVIISIGALSGTSAGVTFGSQIVVSGLTIPAGATLTCRVQVTGTNPTAIRTKVWAAADTEPATWQLTGTDSTPALQAAGSVGLAAYLSSSSTSAPVIVRVSSVSGRAVTP